MRKISKNEIRLLLILGGAVALMANVLLLRHGIGIVMRDRDEIAALRTQYASYLHVLDQASDWKARGEWRKQHPLPIYDASKSDSDFVERVQRSLTASGLHIQEQQLKESVKKDAFVAISLNLKITGELENLVRWMTSLQKAGSYSEIRNFTLKAADDPSTMVATMDLFQFFAPSGARNLP
ncbi:MAG TPA: GspMb/PilO family protein [Chthoniobacterales bacterium]